MCGISAILSFTQDPEYLEHIKKMTDCLRHRGPDDEGFAFFGADNSAPYVFGGNDTPESVYHSNCPYTPRQPVGGGNIPKNAMLALGHRRLSVLDLSPAGHQPMCNEDGTIWIVYNGEIYNFFELRDELRSFGHHFVSHTDTEVILHAYEEWGETCLERFNGMWAFVIYDTTKHVLFGARDRFGVKPLYYYQDKNIFALASEIKALVSLPCIKKEINPEAVFNYLVLEINEPDEEGFFKNIFELMPAYTFHYDLSNRSFQTWRYYTLNFKDDWEDYDSGKCERYIETIRESIFRAIQSRLRSDVPVGSCLSGGIDSSSIVCVINTLLQHVAIEQIGKRQKVFTASYDMNMIDESKWAKIVVEKTNASWYQTFLKSSELLADLEDFVYTHDIPFSSTSMYAQYRVMKLAYEHGIKVLLDGQGGDELFTGYIPYYGTFFFEMLKHGAIVSFLQEFSQISHAPLQRKILLFSLIRLLGLQILPSSVIAWQRKRNAQKKMLHNYCNRDFWTTYHKKVEGKKVRTTMTSLNAMLKSFMADMKLSSLLRYEDRNSMRFSIESRTPFADDMHLIEAVFHIPSIYKIHNGWSKYLLRQAMKGVVPEAILSRTDKIGFATPEYYWLQDLSQTLKLYFTADLQEYLDVKRLQQDWYKVMENQPHNGTTKMWRFVNFAVWKKVYGV